MRYCYCEASSSASVVYVVRLRMLIFSMAALYKSGVPWNPMNPPWIRHWYVNFPSLIATLIVAILQAPYDRQPRDSQLCGEVQSTL